MGCPPQIKGKIEHFIARKAMNIDSLGPETIDSYYNKGLIKDVADLYCLTIDDINEGGAHQKSAKKVIDAIEKSKQVPFDRVLFALGIRFVGETSARLLARKFNDINSLRNATAAQLLEVEGVGDIIAASVVSFFADEKNIALIERLESYGLQMAMPVIEEGPKGNVLEGKTIVISGVFTHHSRDEYKAMIEQLGGKNTGSISAKTSFVLAGDNMGPSKLQKAESLGVKILSEDEFLEMIK